MVNSSIASNRSSNTLMTDYAGKYIEAGFCPVPVRSADKIPIEPNWQKTTIENVDLNKFHNGCNIGIVLGDASGGLVDIDLDTTESESLAPYFLPHTDCVFGRPSKPRSHFIYRVTGATKTIRFQDRNSIIEIRGTGGHTVFPGSVHKSGEAVEFFARTGDNVPSPGNTDLQTLKTAAVMIAIASVCLKNWTEGKRHQVCLAAAGYLAKQKWSQEDVEYLIRAIAECTNDCEIDSRLNDVKTTFNHHRSGNPISGFQMLKEAVGMESAKSIAGWLQVKNPTIPIAANSNNCISSASFSTDAAAAKTFADHNRNTVRFCSENSQWYIKRNEVFEPVRQAEMQGRVTELVSSIQKMHPSVDMPKAMASRSRINSTIELARSHSLVPADTIDQETHIVGLNDGNILDLKTRQLVFRDDVFVTRKLGTNYDPLAKCPVFENFASRIFDNDLEIIEFVRRAIGYTLCGETTEQCLFILLGSGANGKSTLLNILDALFGDYAGTTPMQTLTSSKFSSGQTSDLAAMEGKRFISASDGEAEQRLAVNKIKNMTGGDKITCRALYKDFSTFKPQFKLWIATNDMPEAPGADEALMRRIHVIEFPVVIPLADRDPHLAAKLASEAAGIFNWALNGYDDWTTSRLRPPVAVSKATDTYRQANDPVGQFILDNCEVRPTAKVTTKDLYWSYDRWCTANGHEVLPLTEFGKVLGRKNFENRKVSGNAGWAGIELNFAEKMKMSS